MRTPPPEPHRESIVVDVLGSLIAVRGPRSVMTPLSPLLADVSSAGRATSALEVDAAADGTLRITLDGSVLCTDVDAPLGPATVIWALNTVAGSTAHHVVLHAGCVASSGAVLLPGASGSGKSTLTAALVSDGIDYLSDEFAAIDREDGRIVAFPKPMQLGDRIIPASVLGRALPARRAAPSGIVFPRFLPGATTVVTELSPAGSFVALASHVTNLTLLGADALPYLAALALACPAWQITYHDTDDAVRLVRDLAACPGAPLEPVPPLTPATDTTVSVPLGDDVVVYDTGRGRIHLLNRSAAEVWRAFADLDERDVRRPEVIAHRTARLPFARRTVDATVVQLVSSGLLRVPPPPRS